MDNFISHFAIYNLTFFTFFLFKKSVKAFCIFVAALFLPMRLRALNPFKAA